MLRVTCVRVGDRHNINLLMHKYYSYSRFMYYAANFWTRIKLYPYNKYRYTYIYIYNITATLLSFSFTKTHTHYLHTKTQNGLPSKEAKEKSMRIAKCVAINKGDKQMQEGFSSENYNFYFILELA